MLTDCTMLVAGFTLLVAVAADQPLALPRPVALVIAAVVIFGAINDIAKRRKS